MSDARACEGWPCLKKRDTVIGNFGCSARISELRCEEPERTGRACVQACAGVEGFGAVQSFVQGQIGPWSPNPKSSHRHTGWCSNAWEPLTRRGGERGVRVRVVDRSYCLRAIPSVLHSCRPYCFKCLRSEVRISVVGESSLHVNVVTCVGTATLEHSGF